MTTESFCKKYYEDRKDTNCSKWDELEEVFGEKDLLPMWVADMEFKTPECVVEAIQKRAEHGIYGYTFVSDSCYEAVEMWQQKRHGITIKRDWIRFSTGVIQGLFNVVQACTKVNDSILFFVPVYSPFMNTTQKTGRRPITCELLNEGNKGYYTIDFEAFEKAIVENDVKMFIQCSPHNPVGRCWTEEEQAKLFEICEKYNVIIVSDEIHQDILITGSAHLPALAVKGGAFANRIITLISATKTFNLASLIHAHVFIADETLRKQYDEYIERAICLEGNLFGMTATEAAYRGGEEWLDSLLVVVKENYRYVKQTFQEKTPKIVVSPLEGTYLLWIDLRAYLGTKDLKSFIQGKCKLAVSYGEGFVEGGKGFIRLNLGTHPKFVEQAVKIIVDNIERYCK